jgi:hypothetical protein
LSSDEIGDELTDVEFASVESLVDESTALPESSLLESLGDVVVFALLSVVAAPPDFELLSALVPLDLCAASDA